MAGISQASLGVFDLCHFALLKRGCANSSGLKLAEGAYKITTQPISGFPGTVCPFLYSVALGRPKEL